MEDGYRTEEQQVEAIKEWWKQNGNAIIAGIVIGLMAIFGWRGYNENLIKEAQEASLLYEQMVFASRSNDAENSRVYADRIIADHESTLYGTYAKLMIAKLEAENGNLDEAAKQLEWVVANHKQIEIGHIASLRLARVYIDADKLDAAEQILNTKNPGAFTAQYEELKGDMLAKQGLNDAAREAYQKAMSNSINSNDVQTLLETKLNNLGQG